MLRRLSSAYQRQKHRHRHVHWLAAQLQTLATRPLAARARIARVEGGSPFPPHVVQAEQKRPKLRVV
jgi:hypothetical protein